MSVRIAGDAPLCPVHQGAAVLRHGSLASIFDAQDRRCASELLGQTRVPDCDRGAFFFCRTDVMNQSCERRAGAFPILHGEWNASTSAGRWTLAVSDGCACDHAARATCIRLCRRPASFPIPISGAMRKSCSGSPSEDWVLERRVEMAVPDVSEGSWYLDHRLSRHGRRRLRQRWPSRCSADNCFRRYRPDVSHALRRAKTASRSSCIRASRLRQERGMARQPFDSSLWHRQLPDPRTATCCASRNAISAGTGTSRIAPLGIYGTVALRKLDPARIEHVETRAAPPCRWLALSSKFG